MSFGLPKTSKPKPHIVRLDFKGSPLDLFPQFLDGYEYAYILESVGGHEKLAEYSFIGFEPRFLVTVKDGKAEVRDRMENEVVTSITRDPLKLMKGLLGGHRKAGKGYRFMGGAVGYLSYDAIRYWEKLPSNAIDDIGFPDLEMAIFDDGIVFDHRTGEVFYYYLGENRLSEIDLRSKVGCNLEGFSYSEPKRSLEKGKFEEIVAKAKDYIVSGDVFQVVLSKRYDFNFRGSLIPFYSALRTINPSPYMYFLKLGNRQIVGSSPEMLVRVEGSFVETFPIAGTRPRLKEDPEKDEALALELTLDPKECAEHLMLVDLARNDIGRVSEFGSVLVPEFMKVYRYSHVQHMVSRVLGRLRQGSDCYDALKALFPAGTVSGAPKVRAMEIIEECEPFRRGPYAGALGYFSYNGNADFAITIRTLFAEGGSAYIQAGAGIVADSIPENEWFETEHKALALLRALRIASDSGTEAHGGVQGR